MARDTATSISTACAPAPVRRRACSRPLANEQMPARCACWPKGNSRWASSTNASSFSQSALSQHLASCEEGLVVTRREAQSVYYALAPGPAGQVIATLHDIYRGPSAPLCATPPREGADRPHRPGAGIMVLTRRRAAAADAGIAALRVRLGRRPARMFTCSAEFTAAAAQAGGVAASAQRHVLASPVSSRRWMLP